MINMEKVFLIYVLPALCLLLGIGYSVMESVSKLHKKYPQYGMKSVIWTFISEEWNNLLISVLVFFTYMLFIFISQNNGYVFQPWFAQWGVFLLAFVLGYAGQRIAYSALKSTEGAIRQKIANFGNRDAEENAPDENNKP